MKCATSAENIPSQTGDICQRGSPREQKAFRFPHRAIEQSALGGKARQDASEQNSRRRFEVNVAAASVNADHPSKEAVRSNRWILSIERVALGDEKGIFM